MKKLLIADSIREDRDELADIFLGKYDVDYVYNYDDTIDAVRMEKYECLILDLNFDGKSGISVLSYLDKHSILEQIPVVVVTNENSAQQHSRAYTLGASEIITRPFDNIATYERIKNIIELFHLNSLTRCFYSVDAHLSASGVTDNQLFFNIVSDVTEQNALGTFFIIYVSGMRRMTDEFGCNASCRLLTKFSDVLLGAFGEPAVITHLGGDEFAVFVQDLVRHQDINEKAARVLSNTESAISLAGRHRSVRVIIGAAVYPEHAENARMLFKCADEAAENAELYSSSGFHIYDRRYSKNNNRPARNEFTNIELSEFLRGRREEKKQIWVNPGEIRIIWNSFSKFGGKKPCAAALISVNPISNVKCDVDKTALISEKICSEIRRNAFTGVFSLYSRNEILALIAKTPDSEEKIKKFLIPFEEMYYSDNIKISCKLKS